MAMAATFMMKLVIIMTKKAMLMVNTNQLAFLEHDQPVDGQPLGGPGLPEAETDAHGAGKQQDDVPGNGLQIVDVQDAGDEKQMVESE
jgi:hypothetical protein